MTTITHSNKKPLYICKKFDSFLLWKVTYEAEGFCERNRDVLFSDLIQLIQSSQSYVNLHQAKLLITYFKVRGYQMGPIRIS